MEKYITNNPVESVQYPGFYITTVSDKIVISPMGEFILIDTGRKLHINPVTEKTPYPALWIPGLNGCSVHRCLAITFLKCPGDPEKYQVNHINGDKSNYSLNNLEWVSPTDDLVHAFKTELRTDNRKVLAKDLHTDTIVEYYSQAACAKALGVTPATLHSFMFKSGKNWPLKERWDVIRKGDEWSKLTKKDVGKVSSPSYAMVITISEDELEINAYDTLSNMAAILDITISEATNWLLNGKSNVEHNLRVLRLIDYVLDVENEKRLSSIKTIPRKKTNSSTFKNKPTPIRVTDTNTCSVKEYPSVQCFSEIVDAQRKTIQKSIWKNKGLWKHYNIEYMKEDNTT